MRRLAPTLIVLCVVTVVVVLGAAAVSQIAPASKKYYRAVDES